MELGVVWTSGRGCTVSGGLVGGGFWDAYRTLVGSDIQFWTNGFNISIVDNLDGSETVTDRDNTPTQDLTGKRFARIQVSP